jgi:hypothetical protein
MQQSTRPRNSRYSLQYWNTGSRRDWRPYTRPTEETGSHPLPLHLLLPEDQSGCDLMASEQTTGEYRSRSSAVWSRLGKGQERPALVARSRHSATVLLARRHALAMARLLSLDAHLSISTSLILRIGVLSAGTRSSSFWNQREGSIHLIKLPSDAKGGDGGRISGGGRLESESVAGLPRNTHPKRPACAGSPSFAALFHALPINRLHPRRQELTPVPITCQRRDRCNQDLGQVGGEGGTT